MILWHLLSYDEVAEACGFMSDVLQTWMLVRPSSESTQDLTGVNALSRIASTLCYNHCPQRAYPAQLHIAQATSTCHATALKPMLTISAWAQCSHVSGPDPAHSFPRFFSFACCLFHLAFPASSSGSCT